MNDPFLVHHTVEEHADRSTPDPHQDHFSKTLLGFWTYLMTDCLLFATLFLTYAVFKNSTFGGPDSKQLFELHIPFAETMILLTSSITSGLAMLAAVRSDTRKVFLWLTATLLLGASFLALEFTEFHQLFSEGATFQTSAFLSAFFTLVGTHGTHVAFGLLWLLVLLAQFFLQGTSIDTFRRLALFTLFWHFLDLIWIFIFTFVYLFGVI